MQIFAIHALESVNQAREFTGFQNVSYLKLVVENGLDVLLKLKHCNHLIQINMWRLLRNLTLGTQLPRGED
jgi:hypothetical protein